MGIKGFLLHSCFPKCDLSQMLCCWKPIRLFFFVFQQFVFIDFPCSSGPRPAVHWVYIWQSVSSSVLLSRWRTWWLMKWFSSHTPPCREPAAWICTSRICMASVVMWPQIVAQLQPVRQNRCRCGFVGAYMGTLPVPAIQFGSGAGFIYSNGEIVLF